MLMCSTSLVGEGEGKKRHPVENNAYTRLVTERLGNGVLPIIVKKLNHRLLRYIYIDLHNFLVYLYHRQLIISELKTQGRIKIGLLN